MNLDTLSNITDELHSVLQDGIVDRIYESSRSNIIMIIRKNGSNFYLLISAERPFPRMHLVTTKPAPSAGLHPFVLFARSRIMGGRISGISLLNRDRVVEMFFSRRGVASRLLVELIGSSANLVMTDPTGKILAVYHPIPLSDKRRALIPGIEYLPPARKKASADMPEGDGIPVIRNAGADAVTSSANQRAEIFFERAIAKRRIESGRLQLRSLLKKLTSRTERRFNALTADKRMAESAEEYRLSGDLILANLGELSTGMRQAELTGYDGVKRLVVLDPGRSPAGNAEQFFKRYKKAKSGRSIIEERLQLAGRERSVLRSLSEKVESAEDEASLASVRSELAIKGYLRIDPDKNHKQPEAAACGFRKVLYQGWEIIVGRNAGGNDRITTSIAKADDLWLHAEGLPGSHVLIRNPQSREIPDGVLARAASLAAFYSKGRSAGKVPVTYTRARNVRKPKGAKPGLVTLSERRTMIAVPQECDER